jgi:hypothetical protein
MGVVLALVGATLAVRSLRQNDALAASTKAEGTLFGASASSRGWLARSTAEFGHLPIVRTEYGGLPPANVWTTGVDGVNHSAVVVSFAALPSKVLSGADNAALSHFFDTAPTGHPIYYAYYYQPEVSVRAHRFSVGQYKAAWAHIAKLAKKAHNPDLKSTLILRAQDLNRNSGLSWKSYLPAGRVISTLAWTAYPARTSVRDPQLTLPAEFMGRAVAASKSAGLPFGFAAFALATAHGRPWWLKEVANYLTSRGALFGVVLNSPGHPAMELTDAASIAAWRSIVAASGTGNPMPVGPSPTPVPQPTTPKPTTPSPTPSSTGSGSPSPSPSSPSPSQSTSPPPTTGVPAGVAWQSSSPMASWQDPGGQFVINNDEWSGDHGPETIWANSYHNFGVVSDQADTSDVKVYPDVDYPLYKANKDPLYSSISSIHSTFAEQMPSTSHNFSAEAAYDVWLNNWKTEMMIWVDTHNRDLAASGETLRATMTSGGQTWQLWTSGSGVTGYYAFALKGNEQSGSVNVLDFIDYLVSHNYLPTTTTVTDIEFGWEICSTGNVPLNFTLTNYSLKVAS